MSMIAVSKGYTERKLVLVVDDEENMLDTVRFILESAGYRVAVSRNGEEALELLASLEKEGTAADLVLTDIQMPGLTGLELIDGIRTLGRETALVVMTGYGTPALEEELRRRGCAGMLEKPFEEEELLTLVAQVLAPDAS